MGCFQEENARFCDKFLDDFRTYVLERGEGQEISVFRKDTSNQQRDMQKRRL
jgi:hypothetical protein